MSAKYKKLVKHTILIQWSPESTISTNLQKNLKPFSYPQANLSFWHARMSLCRILTVFTSQGTVHGWRGMAASFSKEGNHHTLTKLSCPLPEWTHGAATSNSLTHRTLGTFRKAGLVKFGCHLLDPLEFCGSFQRCWLCPWDVSFSATGSASCLLNLTFPLRLCGILKGLNLVSRACKTAEG